MQDKKPQTLHLSRRWVLAGFPLSLSSLLLLLLMQLHPAFGQGKNLRQIMVDFDQAENNGFQEVIGKSLAETIIIMFSR